MIDSTHTPSVPSSSRTPFSRARLAWATLAASVANAVLFLVFAAAGGRMVVTQPAEQRLSVLVAIIATLVPLALAGIAVWFLARRWPMIRTVAAWAGLGVGVLSAFSPALVASDAMTAVGLGLMHVVAGVAWFVGIRPVPARIHREAAA